VPQTGACPGSQRSVAHRLILTWLCARRKAGLSRARRNPARQMGPTGCEAGINPNSEARNFIGARRPKGARRSRRFTVRKILCVRLTAARRRLKRPQGRAPAASRGSTPVFGINATRGAGPSNCGLVHKRFRAHCPARCPRTGLCQPRHHPLQTEVRCCQAIRHEKHRFRPGNPPSANCHPPRARIGELPTRNRMGQRTLPSPRPFHHALFGVPPDLRPSSVSGVNASA